MNKITIVASLVGALALQSVANAGFNAKSLSPVIVSPSSGTAQGALITAAKSSDSNQRIGCAGETLLGTVFVVCFATDATGTSVACSVMNASDAMLQIVNSINSTSLVQFQYNTTTNVCQSIDVENDSAYL